MDQTIETKTNTILLALLWAMLLLIGVAYMHKHHFTNPVTIPQAVELRWAADTAWGNW